jgi:hypothetical protein
MTQEIVEVDEKVGIQDIMLELEDERWKSTIRTDRRIHNER